MNFADRVKETTATAGTGDITLSGVAASSFNTFSASFSVGDHIPYCIVDQSGGAWEVGQGTLTSATTFARSTVTASSNAGLLVNFGSGIKDVFCTLSADLFKKISRATSANVFYLTKNGATDDANLAQFSATFGTDSTAAIQSVLDQASASNPIEVVFDGKFSVTGLRVKGYTTITALPGCGAILRTSSAKSLLENYNLSFAAGVRTDKNIKIRGGIWNGNAGTANANNIKGNGTVGLVCAMRFYGVENLEIVPEAITNSPSYALHTINCARYSVARGVVDCGIGGVINMDGIHADGNCEDITFRDMTITSHDDAIGFNADDQWRYASNFTALYYPSAALGPVKNATVENVILKSQLFGLRVLSGTSRVDNLVFKNIKGSTTGLAMIIDNYWQATGNIAPNNGAGNIGTVEIDGMDVAITAVGPGYTNDCTININCNADKIVIRNLKRSDFYFARPTILISGAGTVIKSLVIEGYESLDAASAYVTPHIKIDGATVTHLKISGATVKRGGASNGSALVKVTSSGSIGTLQIDNVTVDALDNLLDNSAGTITRILATNIIHLNETGGQATFKTASTISRLGLSGYIGTLPTSGTFSTTSGDGIAVVADTTAPTLVSAVVANATPAVVTLTMSEALDAANVPAAGAFTVTGHTVSSVVISGSVISLTCSASFVNGEAASTVSYTQPGTANARDTAGNMLANFSTQAITNNVAAATAGYVTLAGDAFLVDDGTTKSLTGSATTDATYHRYLGAAGTSKLAAGVDGYIAIKFLGSAANQQADLLIGFNTTNSSATVNAGFTFVSAQVLHVVNGIGTGLAASVVGNLYNVARTGTQVKLNTSSDNGATWTTLYTYALATSAEIYVVAALYQTDRIPNMTGVGLS